MKAIKGAKTIEEFKKMQTAAIQFWIDEAFEKDAVTWEYASAYSIKITDKKGDSIVLSLDQLD